MSRSPHAQSPPFRLSPAAAGWPGFRCKRPPSCDLIPSRPWSSYLQVLSYTLSGTLGYELTIPESTGCTDSVSCEPPEAVMPAFSDCEVSGSRVTHRRRHYLTLMAYSTFEENAKVLSDKELKLMRVVSLRVLRVLTSDQDFNLSRAKRKAVNLWNGHTQALVRYGMSIARELVNRGYKDTSMEEFRSHFVRESVTKPSWVFWARLQRSHRAYINLRRLREEFAQKMAYWLEAGGDTRGLRG